MKLARLAVLVVVAPALVLVTSAEAQVEHWGSYIGNGERFPQERPFSVPGLGNGVTEIAAGNGDSYAVEEGQLEAFGPGTSGALGDGSFKDAPTTPVRAIFPAGTVIAHVGEAKNDMFAIDTTGQLWSAGSNLDGSLCLGTSGRFDVPQEVPGGTDVVQVRGGANHVIVLRGDGTVEACGENERGQLGKVGATSKTLVPVPGLSNIVEICSGPTFGAARTALGEVLAWGSNEEGQLGQGTESRDNPKPTRVPLPGPAQQISCGGDLLGNGHMLALIGGEVFGWGADRHGQIGDQATVNKPSPVATGLAFESVAASGNYSLGVRDGMVFGWGSTAGGTLGEPELMGAQLTPVLITEGTAVSATAQNSMSD